MTIRLTPTVLLTILQPWGEVAEPISKRVADIANASEGGETLWVGCGSGRAVVWWARKFRSMVQGLDPDQVAIEDAEARVRGTDLTGTVTFQHADPTNLPHEDCVFDTVVVHLLFMRDVAWEAVLREAVRVLRPTGNVVVVAPSWLQTPRESDQKLIESLGFSPRVTMRWKRCLRESGAVELSVEEAVKDGYWFTPGMFSLAVRGWHAAGWVGVRTVLSREMLALQRLARKRVLGLSFVKGSRLPETQPQ